MRLSLIDPEHPFYRPLWRRVLIVGLCGLAVLMELSRGSGVWAAVFGALGFYAAWRLLWAFPSGEKIADDSEDEP